MSYIFRLHTQASGNCEDWQGDTTTKYSSGVIEEMSDASPKSEITSIPSPFARIDLVKNAFKKVNRLGIEGDTIHHKMVSDCLDVGQIFFEFDKLSDKIEILTWDKNKDKEELLASPYQEHRQLGHTYDLFLKQDSETYNFDKMNEMFFLNYINGPHAIDIIGATSPATLFFTPGNPETLKRIGSEIRFGNDCPFDGELIPLYKRNLDYQKYWYLLQRNIPNFPRLFREVDEYLTQNFEKLDPESRTSLRTALNTEDLTQYADIPLKNAGHVVQVLDGIVLKKKVQELTDIQDVSGFVIQSNETVEMSTGNCVKPLVLPVDVYILSTIYTTDRWDKHTTVPFYDPRQPKDRTLPGDCSLYPYLTISDFLEDTIVRMPYELNKASFFNGNLDRDDDGKENRFSYLLPLTSCFFKFFTVKDLETLLMDDGKKTLKMFELRNKVGGVIAILRIPIRQGYIEYSRTYVDGLTADSARTNKDNYGALVEKKFGLGILPLIKFKEDAKKHYRIALSDKGHRDVKLTCYNGLSEVKTNYPAEEENKPIVRDGKDPHIGTNSSETYVINDDFDRIDVMVGDFKGVIVPRFVKEPKVHKKFTFAVDFGTTNTHIEYSADNEPPASFDIRSGEKQMHLLHENYRLLDKDIAGFFDHDFIPATIGDNDAFSFPMRTVFQEQKGIKYDNRPITLADGNIPFFYEKAIENSYNNPKTDLKWTGEANGIVELYLSNIFMLMRNKVGLNGGSLPDTKVVWFYPASMTEGRCNQLNKIWKKLYGEYFGDNANTNVICMSESVAPYHFIKGNARSNVVTIDVGGGTTDVYIVQGYVPQMLLSFRFASNAIFGDGYNNNEGSNNNGFVRSYMNKFKEVLQSNEKSGLVEVLKNIESKKKSPDIIAFLFSLAQNPEVKGNASLDFLSQLSNDDRMRYVFIVFYGAILYYIAKSMKAKGLEKPLRLAFSGNGSKTLQVLSDNKDIIGKFAKLIFDGVFNDGKDTPLDIKVEPEPKKATCKGGILNPISQNFDEIDEIKCSLLGNGFDEISVNQNQLRYSEITPDIKAQVTQQVSEFIDFLFGVHDDNNNFFTNKLTADPGLLQFVKKTIQDPTELKESLEAGLNQVYENLKGGNENNSSLDELKNSNKVDETLFFYPLIGVLHELARKIGEGENIT